MSLHYYGYAILLGRVPLTFAFKLNMKLNTNRLRIILVIRPLQRRTYQIWFDRFIISSPSAETEEYLQNWLSAFFYLICLHRLHLLVAKNNTRRGCGFCFKKFLTGLVYFHIRLNRCFFISLQGHDLSKVIWTWILFRHPSLSERDLSNGILYAYMQPLGHYSHVWKLRNQKTRI